MRYLPWANKINLSSKLICSAFFIALILIVLLRYLSSQNKDLQNNNHFRNEGHAGMVSFTMPEYGDQRPEIIILHFEGRSVDTISTGFLQNDVRDKHTKKTLWDTIEISTSKIDNWDWLAGKLNYDKAFYHDSDIIQIDSAKLAYTHFQKARCAAKLKNKLETIELLERAFKCSPSLRDTLQAEMARPENDWKILEGNWYLREVLLITTKSAPNVAPK